MDERLRSGMAIPGADRVPTLTEVLELDNALEAAPQVLHAAEPVTERALQSAAHMRLAEDASGDDVAAARVPTAVPMPVPVPMSVPVDEDTVVALVVDALLPSLDAMLQERLLEALAPALERAAEQILQDSRAQLAATLHQCVQETVAQVLQSLQVPQG